MSNERNTYKYVVKRKGVIIERGLTLDLKRRASDIKARFPDAVIKQVGRKTTWAKAQEWEGGNK